MYLKIHELFCNRILVGVEFLISYKLDKRVLPKLTYPNNWQDQ